MLILLLLVPIVLFILMAASVIATDRQPFAVWFLSSTYAAKYLNYESYHFFALPMGLQFVGIPVGNSEFSYPSLMRSFSLYLWLSLHSLVDLNLLQHGFLGFYLCRDSIQLPFPGQLFICLLSLLCSFCILCFNCLLLLDQLGFCILDSFSGLFELFVPFLYLPVGFILFLFLLLLVSKTLYLSNSSQP